MGLFLLQLKEKKKNRLDNRRLNKRFLFSNEFFFSFKKKKKKKSFFSFSRKNLCKNKSVSFDSPVNRYRPIFDIVRSDLHDSRSVPAFRTVSPSSCHPLVSWFIGKFDLDAPYTYKGCPIMASAYTLFLFRYFSLSPFFFFRFFVLCTLSPSRSTLHVCLFLSLSLSLGWIVPYRRSGGLISYRFTSEPL